MKSVNTLEGKTSSKALGIKPRFQCQKTVEFERAFRKLDKSAQKIVNQIIQEVLFKEPYESKRLVSPELRGKRSLRKGDYRVIFSICEECKKLHEDRP